MTKSQTYQTRVLTARDNRLIDALERDPRYRMVAQRLRPSGSVKPTPKAAPPEAPPKAETPPEAEVPKPIPKAAPGHVGAISTKDTGPKASGR